VICFRHQYENKHCSLQRYAAGLGRAGYTVTSKRPCALARLPLQSLPRSFFTFAHLSLPIESEA
jgi:hypothetical protein